MNITSFQLGEHKFYVEKSSAMRSSSSVVITLGEMKILCSLSLQLDNTPKKFTPLTIHYQERPFSHGNFNQKKNKNSEREVLISRLVHRSLAPFVPKNLTHNIQIVILLMKNDERYYPDVPAIISAIITLGMVNIEGCDISDISVFSIGTEKNCLLQTTGKKSRIVAVLQRKNIAMIECQAEGLSKEDVLNQLKEASLQSKSMSSFITQYEKKEPVSLLPNLTESFLEEISENLENKEEIYKKHFNHLSQKELLDYISITKEEILAYYNSKQCVLGKRTDGRKYNEIREITISRSDFSNYAVSFTRGKTSVVSVCVTDKERSFVSDSYDHIDFHDRLSVLYSFFPFSVNEVSKPNLGSRREVGHSKLIRNALISSIEKNPCNVRIFGEVLSSDGSSSAATICGGSIAMKLAGIKHKLTSALSCGLFKYKNSYQTVTDINEKEDAYGEADLKIGYNNHFTAAQLDTKRTIPLTELKKLLSAAEKGAKEILKKMESFVLKNFVEEKNLELKIKIPSDKLGRFIGMKGKNIHSLQQKTNCSVQLEENIAHIVAKNKKEAFLCQEEIHTLVATEIDIMPMVAQVKEIREKDVLILIHNSEQKIKISNVKVGDFILTEPKKSKNGWTWKIKKE